MRLFEICASLCGVDYSTDGPMEPGMLSNEIRILGQAAEAFFGFAVQPLSKGAAVIVGGLRLIDRIVWAPEISRKLDLPGSMPLYSFI
jgi:hypothetical protein